MKVIKAYKKHITNMFYTSLLRPLWLGSNYCGLESEVAHCTNVESIRVSRANILFNLNWDPTKRFKVEFAKN